MLGVKSTTRSSNWKIIFGFINSGSFDSNDVSKIFINICLLEFFVAENCENREKFVLSSLKKFYKTNIYEVLKNFMSILNFKNL